jgi:hypothetical protein
MEPTMRMTDLIPGTEFTVGGKRYTVRGCDDFDQMRRQWRRVPSRFTTFWVAAANGTTMILRGTPTAATVVPSCTFNPTPVASGRITLR